MNELEQLKYENEFLKEKVKDCERHMTDQQNYRMKIERQHMELDFALEKGE